MGVIGNYCYRTTVKELLKTDISKWESEMNDNFTRVDKDHYWSSYIQRWKTDYRVLVDALRELPEDYGDLQVVFEYVLPLANPQVLDEDFDKGIRIDALILGADAVLILDFKNLTINKDLNKDYRDRLIKCKNRMWGWHVESMGMAVYASLVFCGGGVSNYLNMKTSFSICSGDRLAEAIIDRFGNAPVSKTEEAIVKWLDSDFRDMNSYSPWHVGFARPKIRVSDRISINGEWSFELPDSEDFIIESEHYTGWLDIIDGNHSTPDPIMVKAVRRDMMFEQDEDSGLYNETGYVLEITISSDGWICTDQWAHNSGEHRTTADQSEIEMIKQDIDYDVYNSGPDYVMGLKIERGVYRPLEAEVLIRGTEINNSRINMTIIPDDVTRNELERALEYIKCIAETVDVIRTPEEVVRIHTIQTDESCSTDENKQDKFIIEHGYLVKNNGLEREVIIPEGVKAIDEGVFRNNLRMDRLVLPESLESIKEGAFEGCRGLTVLSIPDGVRVIEKGAFRGCANLSEVSLPDALEELGEEVFSECSSLSSISIPEKIRELKMGVMSGCYMLREVIFPKELEKIGEDAFRGCKRLKTIALPEHIEHIGRGAFSECGLTGIVISESIKRVGDGAFMKCSDLERVEYKGKHPAIEANTFHECYVVKEVILPEELKRIGESAFEGCRRLEKIEIPETVTRIEERAFCNTGLEHISIPDSIDEIADETFRECKSLKRVQFNEKIISIGSGAFEESGLKKVRLPGGINRIESNLFSDCDDLEEVYIPKGVQLIEEDAFSNCKSLKVIDIPSSVERICTDAFNGCSELKRVKLHEGLMGIGDTAFQWCYNLRDIKFPNSLMEIGDQAFEHCDLKMIRIPGSVRSFGSYVFEGCGQLHTAVLEDGVDEMWPDAFRNCTALKEIHCSESTYDSIDEYDMDDLEGVKFVTK